MILICADKKDSEYIGRRMLMIELPGRRQRGRPKRRFMVVMREDMQIADVTEEDAEDGERLRAMICWADSKKKNVPNSSVQKH